jgi:hypothetical protein
VELRPGGGTFDGDGDQDLLVGNLGLNTKFRASPREPVEVYAHDYDQNGHLDPLLTYYLQGKQVLVAPRDLLAAQMPAIKKRFPDYQSYARATFTEAFSTEERRAAYHAHATELRSMYYENRGDGTWVLHPLPLEAQVSPVLDALVRDFNGDGYPDALLVGNFYATETIGGWYDASAGTLLMGTDRGRFRVHPAPGLRADRDARRVVALNGTQVLVTNNNGPVQVWAWRQPPASPTGTLSNPHSLRSK